MYRGFYFQNRPFIEQMVAMYSAEEKNRSITTVRTDTAVNYEDQNSLKKLAINNRMLLAGVTNNMQKFYS